MSSPIAPETATIGAGVSPTVKPLQTHDLPDTLRPMIAETPAERAIMRVKDEMNRKHLSQRDLAALLEWSQSRVSKNLSGRIELRVNDLAALCFGVGIPLTEAVRDHGLEFCAEMTPTELRLLERLRKADAEKRDAVFTLFEVPRTSGANPERHAGLLSKKRGLTARAR